MIYNKITFVCSSDTCRGPMAKAIIKKMLIHRPVEIRSRGLVVLFPEPPNQKADAVLKSNHMNLDGYMSTQLTEEDFTEDGLILTMEEKQKQTILEDYKNAKNVYTLMEILGLEGDLMAPYGGALTEYGVYYEYLYKLLEKLVEKINREEI